MQQVGYRRSSAVNRALLVLIATVSLILGALATYSGATSSMGKPAAADPPTVILPSQGPNDQDALGTLKRPEFLTDQDALGQV